eukprot:scaffold2835_cov259-Pinguiococcus_pyrenoidosus.AAC.1
MHHRSEATLLEENFAADDRPSTVVEEELQDFTRLAAKLTRVLRKERVYLSFRKRPSAARARAPLTPVHRGPYSAAPSTINTSPTEDRVRIRAQGADRNGKPLDEEKKPAPSPADEKLSDFF